MLETIRDMPSHSARPPLQSTVKTQTRHFGAKP